MTNANCLAHARRHLANAIKAIGKENQKAVRSSVAYKALVRIGAIYDQEEYLKVFLSDGEVPIDDSASERVLRNFTIG